jgi:hypothetical protein
MTDIHLCRASCRGRDGRSAGSGVWEGAAAQAGPGRGRGDDSGWAGRASRRGRGDRSGAMERDGRGRAARSTVAVPAGAAGAGPASNRTDRKSYLGMRLIPLARSPEGKVPDPGTATYQQWHSQKFARHSLGRAITRGDLCPTLVGSRHSLLRPSRDKLRHLGKEAQRYGWQGA